MKKELVEKMREAINNLPHMLCDDKDIAETCAAVVSEHYGDKWTRVEDGLPENDLPHLVATDCSGRSYTNRYPHRYVDGEWHCDGDPNVTGFIVTHWQPLPEDPQQ